MEDVRREEGMYFEVMTWLNDLEWIELAASIEEGGLVSVVGTSIKGEEGVAKPKKSKQDKLVDERASLIGPNEGTKSSLLAMVSLKYLGKRNSLPFRVLIRGKS